MSTKIKICGISSIETGVFCAENGVDSIGLNFSPESKRKIDLKTGIAIRKELKKFYPQVMIVALFYKNDLDTIREYTKELEPDFLQYVVRDSTINFNDLLEFSIPVIPQYSVKKEITDADLENFPSDLIILDSFKEGEGGGTGHLFEWSLVQKIKRPYLLAGGLNPENVYRAVSVLKPYGVDVASGVESSPGIKDHNLIREFVKNVKRYQ